MSLGNVHLTPQLVQAVRDSVDILDVAAPHSHLEKRGDRYWGLCPFHKEKTPSFSVDPTRGLYYCFGCGAGGDAIRLHMQTSGDDFPAAIEVLARQYGIPLPSRSGPGPRQDDSEEVLAAAAELFVAALRDSPKARSYLEGRRVPSDIVERFGIGYAPDRTDYLIRELQPRFSARRLEQAGLISVRREGASAKAWDRFRDRLIFPIRNPSGRILGFGGRTLGSARAKYLNTAETDRFHKRSVLYGLDVARKAIRERGSILLVEGYFDVIGAAASGIDWAVASMGTAFSQEQARLCARYGEEVVLGYDGDRAGEEASRRALPLLLSQGLGVRRMRLEEGSDPDSLRVERGAEEVRERVLGAADFVEAELARMLPRGEPDPRERARCAHEARDLLSPIPDPVLRFSYGRRVSERLGIPIELLWQSGGNRRGRGGDTEPVPSAPEGAQAPSRREVTGVEERVLQLLLSGEVAVPPRAALPPEGAFLDPVCGNIYRHFLALYVEGGEVPRASEVSAALPVQGEALDRMARILLEGPSCSGKLEELAGGLRVLTRRWQKKRRDVLASRIHEGQRRGEPPSHLRALIDEKNALSRALHDLDPND